MTILLNTPVEPKDMGNPSSSDARKRLVAAHISNLEYGPITYGPSIIALGTEAKLDKMTNVTHVYAKGSLGVHQDYDTERRIPWESQKGSCIREAWEAYNSQVSRFVNVVQEAINKTHNTPDYKERFDDNLMSGLRIEFDRYVKSSETYRELFQGVDPSSLYGIAVFPSDSPVFGPIDNTGPARCLDYSAYENHLKPENALRTQELRQTDWSEALQGLKDRSHTLREIASHKVTLGPKTASGYPTFLAVTLTVRTDPVTQDVMARLEHCIGQSVEFGDGEGGQAPPVTRLSTLVTEQWRTMVCKGGGRSLAEACVRKAILDERLDKSQTPKSTQSEVIASLLSILSNDVRKYLSKHAPMVARDFRVVYYPKETFDSLVSSRLDLECAYTDPLFQGIGEKRSN